MAPTYRDEKPGKITIDQAEYIKMIEDLNLSSLHLSPQQLNELIESILENNKQLRSLNLSNNHIAV